MDTIKFRITAIINGDKLVWYFTNYADADLHVEKLVQEFGLTARDVDFEQAPFSDAGW